MKFRKKPIVIDAVQWWPRGDERHDPSMVASRRQRQSGDIWLACDSTLIGGPDVYLIRTLEGDLKVSPGDWIITGVQGEKYPCKPDIFAATYEPAEGSESDGA